MQSVSAEIALENKLTLLQTLDIAAGERDPNFMSRGRSDWGPGSIVFLFTLGDVTHPCIFGESEGDCNKISSVRIASQWLAHIQHT